MTDDEWWAQRQRIHNAETFRHWPAEKPKRAHHTYQFTPEQLAVAARWHDNLKREQPQHG